MILGLGMLILGLGIQNPMMGALGILVEVAAAMVSPWIAFATFPVYVFLLLAYGGKEDERAEGMSTRYVVAGINGSLLGKQFALSPARAVLDFGTQANMVKLPEGTPGVSRHHCMVVLKNGEVFLTDLNSSYGTYLWQPSGQGPYANPQRIQAEVKYRLYDQTEFFLGSQNIAFQLKSVNAEMQL